jgi:hypothetical protein
MDPSEKFIRQAIKLSVVQICQEVGFNSLYYATIETLTDIVFKCTHIFLKFFIC